jgi:signal transduction histidine kinase
VRTHHRKTKISDGGNILMFDKGVGLDPRNERQRHAPSQLIAAERMSEISRMTCSISHDMRHSLTAIYANAEFLERQDIRASVRADLLLEIHSFTPSTLIVLHNTSTFPPPAVVVQQGYVV